MTDTAEPQCDCAGRLIETNAHEAHCAAMQHPARYSIVGDWLCGDAGGCTCGPGDNAYGHERGCGVEPLILLSDLRASGLILAPVTGEVEYGVRWAHSDLTDPDWQVTPYSSEQDARDTARIMSAGCSLVSRPVLSLPWVDVDA